MIENDEPYTLNNRKKFLEYLILLLLLITGILFNRDFFKKVVNEIVHVSGFTLLSSICLAVLYRVLDGDFLYMLGKRYTPSLSRSKGIRAAFCGSFFRVAALGNGMAISKIYYLTKDGIPVGNSMGICLLQTIFCRISMLILGLISLLLCPPVRKALLPYENWITAGILLCVAVVVFLIILAVNTTLTTTLFQLAKRLLGSHPKWTQALTKAEAQVALLQEEAQKVLKDKKLLAYLLLESLIMQVFWYAIPYLVARSAKITFFQCFAVTAAAHMLSGVIPMPSGFGSVEILFTLMFSQIGSPVLAATAIVIYRFASTFVPFFIGAGVVFYYRREHDKIKNYP